MVDFTKEERIYRQDQMSLRTRSRAKFFQRILLSTPLCGRSGAIQKMSDLQKFIKRNVILWESGGQGSKRD